MKGSDLTRNRGPYCAFYQIGDRESVTVYNPQQVPRQFGYDQGVVLISRDTACSSSLVAEKKVVGRGATISLLTRRGYFGWGWGELGFSSLGLFSCVTRVIYPAITKNCCEYHLSRILKKMVAGITYLAITK